MASDTSFLIVGAGCFGVSTAYHLLKRGYRNVTIVDRSVDLPAPDAASTDLNKIVRSSYNDLFYTKLAREAITAWKEESWTDGVYHESGVLVVSSEESEYRDLSLKHDVALGARVEPCETPQDLRKHIPSDTHPYLEGFTGFLNRDGGWVESGRAVANLLGHVKTLGARVEAGCKITGLVGSEGKTTGIRCDDGRIFHADKVVLAAGSWTASSFEADLNLGLEAKCLATGQTIAKIQLTPEEAAKYSTCPVILDFTSGYYMFPPTSDNIIKVAIHGPGFTRFLPSAQDKPISTPRTIATHNDDDGLRIPQSAVKALRTALAKVYPDLAAKPFLGTRLCWYTETPDEDWHIGSHPTDESLFFATGGSGHAFKFFPVVGRLVADALEGKLEPDLKSKFAIDRTFTQTSLWRAIDPPRELKEDELCTPEDLLP